MAKRQRFDDGPILLAIAEYMAWPEQSEIVLFKDAVHRALLILVPFSKYWPADYHRKAFERLSSKYRKKGAQLVAASRARGRYDPPLPPTLLTYDMYDPEVRQASESKSAERLIRSLRAGSEWFAHLADWMEQQAAGGNIHPKLRHHAEAVVLAIDAELSKDDEGPLAEFSIGLIPRKRRP